MKDFLSNVWVKRAVSVFNLAYFAVVVLLTCATFIYDLEFSAGMETGFFTVYLIARAVFLCLMIFSRQEIVTRFLSILMLPVVFCLIIFNMGDWVLIIPPFIVSIVMFFAAGTHENTKVIMGTIYLLMYVLGLVAYFVITLLFGGTAVETPLSADITSNSEVYDLYKNDFKKLCEMTSDNNTISPDGKYQIIIYDVKDSDKGAVKICVVPYGQDIELKFFTLKQKGISKTISNKGIRGVVPDVGWIIDKEDGKLKVQYRMSPQDDLKKTSVTVMPKKQYLDFLGVS